MSTRPNIGRSRSSWLVRVIGVLLALTMLGLMARAATYTAAWWGIDALVLVAALHRFQFKQRVDPLPIPSCPLPRGCTQRSTSSDTARVMGSFAWFARANSTDARDWRTSLLSMGVAWALLLLTWAANVVLFDVMRIIAP